MARQRLIPAALSGLALVIAFVQRPGDAWSDTRLELAVNPGLFLSRVGDVWSSTTDLGHVQSGQFVGYLFPMGPWFAGSDALGVPLWVAQRLWLALLLALAAWGAMRVMDELYRRERGWAHALAALFFLLNPYTVTFTSRGTVFLLAYAALPWLILAAHRGLRDPRGWRRPIEAALILALAGGGVNAGVIAWALVAPAGLLAYEAAVLGRSWRDAWSFTWRAGVLAALASAWWVVPVLLQGPYGEEFLSFTEQPGTIWGTTSLSESVRLLGFWVMYVGVGFGVTEPFLSPTRTYLFDGPLIVATFLVPLVAFGGVLLTRRWRYAPFFVLLGVTALLVMFAGFPNGTPFRRFLLVAYERAEPLQFLRTTYKIAPLLALSLACLGGAAAAELARRARAPAVRAAAVAGAAGLAAAFGFPLVSAGAIDERQAFGEPPQHWRAAVADAERENAPGRRVAIVPGELFGYYDWGDTMDPVGPALSERPLLIREIVPYADRRSSQFLNVVDDLVQQGRLVPGQLERLLRLAGAGTVLIPADGRVERSGALDPARVEQALAGETWHARARGAYGRKRAVTPARGWGGPELRLPALRRFRLPGAEAAVRVHPVSGATVVEGDAHGVAELAAHSARPDGALRYAGDLTADELRAELEHGGTLILTDSNRRRVVNSARLRQRYGPTLGPEDDISEDSPTFELFERASNDRRTVAVYDGLDAIESPIQPGQAIFPEHRPFAAVDGDLATVWLGDRNLEADRRRLDLRFTRPLRARQVRIWPHADARGRTQSVRISVNGGAERKVELRPGENRVELGGDEVLRSLSVTVGRVSGDERGRGGGGIRELEIPGLRVRERLRLPVAAARAAGGTDLSRAAIDVLLERTTADFPYRAGAEVRAPQARSPLDAVDPERGIERIVALPEPRAFELSGWASADPAAPDDALDRLAGMRDGWRFRSSSRFEGVPANRASSAFDSSPATAWVGDRLPGKAAWIEWSSPRELTLERLRLRPGGPEHATPARVRLSATRGAPLDAAVGEDGRVALPTPLRGRRFRLEVTAVRPAREPERGLRSVAIADVEAPDLAPPAPRRSGSFSSGCETLGVSAGGSRTGLEVSGTLAALDRGSALHVRGCGDLRLPAGESELSSPPGAVFRADHLRLHSAASEAPARAALAPPRVVDQGDGWDGSRDGVRLELGGQPAWLVLGESWSPGWRAYCSAPGADERDLGDPEPIDAFATGWRAPAGCTSARFEFRPQAYASASHIVSLVAALAMLACWGLLALRERGRQPRALAAAAEAPAADPLIRLPWRLALAAGAAAGLAGGFLFALRAGAVLAPLTVFALRVGLNVRRLLVTAAVALALLPAIYLVFPARNRRGNEFGYATDLLGAHWVALAATLCLLGAGVILAARLRNRDPQVGRASASGSRSSTSAAREPAGSGR